ncbi:MAG TPA: acyltransferase [Opitutaceae bacterium]|nr:acyltransferase [Opitutaceae bacterium]
MREGKDGKNTDIEALRAIAILFTLVSHFFWGILPKLGGTGKKIHDMFQFWTGVDLFFCISGFVITTSLMRMSKDSTTGESDQRTWREFLKFASPFWIRRIFRLIPSAWVWISVTLALCAVFNHYGYFGTLKYNENEAIAAVLNLSNFYYFEWFSKHNMDYGAFGVFWSLSLEEQFYILFPFLIFFLSRRTLVSLLIIGLIVQMFADRPNGFDPNHASLLWFVRTDALILGVLIALWKGLPSYKLVEPIFLKNEIASVIFVGCAVLLLGAVTSSFGQISFSTGLAAIICGLLVLLASYDRHYILANSSLKTALVWIGSRSYGIYLIHIPCHLFILELKRRLAIHENGIPAGLLTIMAVPLTLALAELNYRYVEVTFRKIGKRLADNWTPKPSRRVPAYGTPGGQKDFVQADA